MEIDNISGLRRATFESNIRQGTLFRLKGEPPFESENFHVFIVLNRNWESGELLIVENGTTQIESRYHAIERMGLNPDDVAVSIPANKYGFFSKDTMIDCSGVYEVDVNDIHFEASDRFLYINGKLDDDDLQKVLDAVRRNPTISDHIKNKI